MDEVKLRSFANEKGHDEESEEGNNENIKADVTPMVDPSNDRVKHDLAQRPKRVC